MYMSSKVGSNHVAYVTISRFDECPIPHCMQMFRKILLSYDSTDIAHSQLVKQEESKVKTQEVATNSC